MNNWTEQKLGNILDSIVGGGTPLKSNPAYWNGEIPWISVKDLAEGKYYLDSTEDSITRAGLEKSASNLIKAGTVIISTRMGLGRVAKIKIDAAINQDLKALYPNEKVNNDYLLWLLAQAERRIQVIGNGSTVSGIRLGDLKNIQVAIPDITTQKHIASILSAYNDLIENNEKRIKILESLAQSLYYEWFINFKFAGYEKIKMVDSQTEYGRIPEGWKVKKLGEVSDIIFGHNFKSYLFNKNGTGVPVIRIRDVLSGDTETFTSESVEKKYLTHKGDLLIGMDGIFHMNVWPLNGYFLNQRVTRIRSATIPAYFIFESIKKQLYFFQKTIVGSTVGHLSNSNIRNFKILIPKDETMLDNFRDITELIINLRLKNQNLAKTCSFLLPQLVTGRRRLKEIEINKKITSPKKTRQEIFKEAVLFADFVKKSSVTTFVPTHLRVVKYVYFGDRFLGVDPTTKYAEQRFGPYDSKSTYAGGEKVALAKKYVQRVWGGFKAGQKIAEIDKYTYRERSAVDKVVSFMKSKTDDELELLATVDYIVYSKLKNGEIPTEDSIFQYISDSQVWGQKVGRLSLTLEKVGACMVILRQLATQGLPYPH